MEKTIQLNVFLVDGQEMFRQSLALRLASERAFRIIGQSNSASQALEQLGEINMVLLSVDSGDEEGLSFVREARKRGFAGHILVMTAGLSGEEVVKLVQAGAGAIFHKRESVESLTRALRRVAEGGAYLEEAYLPFLFRSLDKTKTPPQLQLPARDKEILRFIIQGRTNRAIGETLETSEGAVKSAVRQLFEKLGVRTRSQLAKIALEQYRDQL
jgi:two-component system nitrate/nitrite response regulator NarL